MNHPIQLVVEDDLERNRLTVFFRLLLAVPHLIWMTLWNFAALVVGIVNWIATQSDREDEIREQMSNIRDAICAKAAEDDLTVRSTPNSGSFATRKRCRAASAPDRRKAAFSRTSLSRPLQSEMNRVSSSPTPLPSATP